MEPQEEKSHREIRPLSKFGFRHIQIFLIFFGLAISCAGIFSMSVAIVAMTDASAANRHFPQFEWDSRIQSYVLSSSLWSFIIFQLLGGYFTNKFNVHKVICASVLMSGIISIAIPFAAKWLDWVGIFCCGTLLGIAQGFLSPSAHTLFARWVPVEESARLGSLIVYAPSFGNVISLPISGTLASSNLGWPGIFYVFGGLAMLWSILFYRVGVNYPSEHPHIRLEEILHIDKSLNLEKKKLKIPWKSMLTSGPVWTLILCHASQGWYFYIFLTKLPAYLKSIFHYDIEETGLMAAVPYIIECSLILPFGYLCDYAIVKGVRLNIVRKVINTLGTWGVAMLLLTLCIIPPTGGSTIPLILLITMFGLNSSNLCGFNINHIDIAPNFAGTLIAILISIEILFGQFALLAFGYIVNDETNINQWNNIFYTICGLNFISNFVFILFGKCELQPWNDPIESSVKILKT